MDIHKHIPDATFHLVHSFYTLIDVKFKSDEDSTNKYENDYTSENILSQLSKKLREYHNVIKLVDSQDSKLEFGKQTYNTFVDPDYKFVLKDARDRLPESEYNFRIDEPVYNGILILLQYLSPNNFNWHYHKSEDSKLRFCCEYESVLLKDLYIHFDLVLVIFIALCQILGDSKLLDEFSKSFKFNELHKNLDIVLRKINGLVSLIHLPLKNNLKFGSGTSGCSYLSPTYISIDFYNKANSHYTLFPTPCKLALLGKYSATLIIFSVLLKNVSNGQFKYYNFLVSTLLVIYNSTCGMILDEIYEVLTRIADDHQDAFLDNSNVLLFKEVINKLSDDINNYNKSAEKCTECFIKLTSAVFNDKDLKIYELLEGTIDKIKIMNKKKLKEIFMNMYYYYLRKVPLACAATMVQMMELVLGTMDTLDETNVHIPLKCIENMFKYLPNDAIYYFGDVYGRFIIIYFAHLSNCDKSRDSLEKLVDYEFFKEMIVRVCVYWENKEKRCVEKREEAMDSIRNIFKIAKSKLEESVFINITHRVMDEINRDESTDGHTLDEMKRFYKMFDL